MTEFHLLGSFLRSLLVRRIKKKKFPFFKNKNKLYSLYISMSGREKKWVLHNSHPLFSVKSKTRYFQMLFMYMDRKSEYLILRQDLPVENVKNYIIYVCFNKLYVSYYKRYVIYNKIKFIIILLILLKFTYFIFIIINTYLSL